MMAMLVVSFVMDTSAQNRKFKRGDYGHRMIENLNLTDDQQTKVDDLRIKHQKEMIDLRSDLDKARLDVRELKNKKDFNRSDLLSLTEKMNNIKNKIALARTNHQMDVYELLDDKQKEEWKDFRPMGKEKRMGFHDKRMMRNRIVE
jgi:Spy/CpxP family protein refolding chaperone